MELVGFISFFFILRSDAGAELKINKYGKKKRKQIGLH